MVFEPSYKSHFFLSLHFEIRNVVSTFKVMSSHGGLQLYRIITILTSFLLLVSSSRGLSEDGILLLSFKYSILSDPFSSLASWNYYDETPCSWHGVKCDGSSSMVISVVLSDSQLLGSIPVDLGFIKHLQNLDFSSNFLNGSLPFSLFNASQLRRLDLSNNVISGDLPELVGSLKNLEYLNLSDNAFAGEVPASLTGLSNLTVVSLRNNYFSGDLPTGFDSVEVLDLSSNLINGSLPLGFVGASLQYLNVSYNKLSGEIPPEFAKNVPGNATVDLSFNNLTGKVPEQGVFNNTATTSFSGNPDLCGKSLKNNCTIPSPANVSEITSPPAIAAIPKTIESSPETASPGAPSKKKQAQNTLKPVIIAGIVIGDIVGIGIVAIVFLYVYQSKKKKTTSTEIEQKSNVAKEYWSTSSSENQGMTGWSCLKKRTTNDEESSDTTESEYEEKTKDDEKIQNPTQTQERGKSGSLVTVDGNKELELETLLKASAYILGATSSSIMYKAVLEDGSVLAVRRIGDSGLERFRDFENQVRVIAKLVHPNLVRIRGFYWGVDEKLVIYDFVANGSLANARYRKVGSSPCHLPWHARLRIAKGVARGLTHLHDKKQVHGNLKPSNILLDIDMEPKIGDFGLERLSGENSYKGGGSARNFGSKRSSASRDILQDLATGPSPSPSPSLIACVSHYHAPESLRSLKPHFKWDVYSFGIVLLELMTGKVVIPDEFGLWPAGLVVEDSRVVRMADVTIRADVEGNEDALLACFKLGYSCVSPVPQKRPLMKEALQVLEKIQCSSPQY